MTATAAELDVTHLLAKTGATLTDAERVAQLLDFDTELPFLTIRSGRLYVAGERDVEHVEDALVVKMKTRQRLRIEAADDALAASHKALLADTRPDGAAAAHATVLAALRELIDAKEDAGWIGSEKANALRAEARRQEEDVAGVAARQVSRVRGRRF